MIRMPMPGGNLPPELLHDHDERAVPVPGGGILVLPDVDPFRSQVGVDQLLLDLERAMLEPIAPGAPVTVSCFR